MRSFLVLPLIAILGCTAPPAPPAGVTPSPVSFSPRDRQLIRQFFAEYAFPPGLAAPSVVARDIEKRLDETGELPPDIGAFPLPAELENRLSPLPPGYARFRAGADVVLMDVRIWQVVDQVRLRFR